MNTKSPSAEESPAAAPADEPPGLPGFRTWRSVYLFALGCYVTYVVLLAVFSRCFP